MIKVKEYAKTHMSSFFIVVLLFGMAFLFMAANSPLGVFSQSSSDLDSSVFKTVALVMDKGGMPYRDTFDHKGPLLYLLNFLGMQIAYYRGTWVVELLFMFTTFCALYKIARLKCDRFYSILLVLLCTVGLFTYFEGGNLVEEYAMPFLAVSLYIYLDYFLNDKLTKWRLIICGLSFAAVFLLRPNMCALWVVLSIAVLIQFIQQKKTQMIVSTILYFLLGFVILVLPIFLWFLCNHAFADFIQAYFTFNFAYSSVEFVEVWTSFLHFNNTTIILFTLLCTIYLIKENKDNKFLFVTYFIYFIVTIFLMSMAGRNYSHYGMVIIPAMIFPLAVLTRQFCTDGKNLKMIGTLFLFYFLSVSVMPEWITTLETVAETSASEKDDEVRSEPETKMAKAIRASTTEEERISVYGNWDIIYVLSRRLPVSKYSYQYPIGEVEPDILDEYFDDITANKPAWLAVQAYYLDDRIADYIEENNFELYIGDKEGYLYRNSDYDWKEIEQ